MEMLIAYLREYFPGDGVPDACDNSNDDCTDALLYFSARTADLVWFTSSIIFPLPRYRPVAMVHVVVLKIESRSLARDLRCDDDSAFQNGSGTATYVMPEMSRHCKRSPRSSG